MKRKQVPDQPYHCPVAVRTLSDRFGIGLGGTVRTLGVAGHSTYVIFNTMGLESVSSAANIANIICYVAI